MASMRRSLFFGACALLGGCASPRAQANIAEAIVQLNTDMSGVKQDQMDMQSTIDSLRIVIARQDTLVHRLATLAGVPVP